MRRIVVTGLGAVSPLGCGVETVWRRLLEGRSGVRRLPDDMVEDIPAKVAGVVPSVAEDAEGGFDPDRVVPPRRRSPWPAGVRRARRRVSGPRR
jgi:3-oxoacyl-[acyl-carrier-protein] synthase II